MRVFLTGGRGFLGRHLMPLLAGHEVLTLARSVNDAALRDGTLTVAGDLAQDGPWQQEVRRFAPEWCIHLAWDGLPDYSLSTCRANVDANIRLIETLVRAGVRRVVVAGSCWEYGRAAGAVSESTTPLEYGVFGAAKLATQAMLDAVSRDAGFDYRWARVFFAYGPGQRSTSLIPHLRDSLAGGTPLQLRDPHAVHDFIHVTDVARGLMALAECDTSSGVYNLGSGGPTSVSQIANIVAGYFGQPAPFSSPGAGSGFWAHPARTFAATGWRPEIDLTDGVLATLTAQPVHADVPR